MCARNESIEPGLTLLHESSLVARYAAVADEPNFFWRNFLDRVIGKRQLEKKTNTVTGCLTSRARMAMEQKRLS